MSFTPGYTTKRLSLGTTARCVMASQGDPRVLVVLNLVLSGVFSTVVVFGLSLVGLLEFTWAAVALATAVLVALTWLVVLR